MDAEAQQRAVRGGLQRERTYLAWQRAGLAFAGAGALLVHAAGELHTLLADIPGVLGLIAGAAILLHSLRSYHGSIRAWQRRRTASTPLVIGLTALATTVVSVTGLVVVLAAV